MKSVQPFALVTLLLLGCVALAITYSADEAHQEAVANAFAAWQGLDDTLEITESEDGEVTFDYGEPASFGPDILSLTVQGSGTLNVLINESKTETLERVLLHETGLALGLSSTDSGIMNPSVADATAELGDSEASALENVFNAVKEDINRDGVVDFYDLNALARAFGQTNLNNPADINGDDVVDETDLELLRAAYRFSPPSETEPGGATEVDEALEPLPELEGIEDDTLDSDEEANTETDSEAADTETEDADPNETASDGTIPDATPSEPEPAPPETADETDGTQEAPGENPEAPGETSEPEDSPPASDAEESSPDDNSGDSSP